MKANENILAGKILQVTAWIVSIAAIAQLALSQFTIRMSRLSTAEQTGIALFAFMLLGLLAVFAVSRMKDGFLAKLFAVAVNFITVLAAAWFLGMLFADEIFMRGILYATDPVTQLAEPLSTSGRVVAFLPIGVVILGAAVHSLAGLTIMVAGFAMLFKGDWKKAGE